MVGGAWAGWVCGGGAGVRRRGERARAEVEAGTAAPRARGEEAERREGSWGWCGALEGCAAGGGGAAGPRFSGNLAE
jgi:hypothetical protein